MSNNELPANVPPLEDKRAWSIWVATLRGKMLTPVYGLLELTGSLLQDARKHPDSPEDFLSSLEGITASVADLLELAEKVLDPGKLKTPGQEFHSQFHHDVRSYLARIIQSCEYWCEDVNAAFLKAFEDDLRKINQIARDLVGCIDDLLSYPKIITYPRYEQRGSISPEAGAIPPAIDESGRRVDSIVGTLLVVDDNELNRHILRRCLEKQGHTVVLAPDGRVALQLIRSQAFDLVLLDLIMPELSGWQVLGQLKADLRFRHLPVIMISALNDMHSLVRCIEIGADDYLSRPVNSVLLHARINACLEKKRLRDREQSYLGKIKRAERRASELLHAVFPAPVIKRMKNSHRPEPRRHRNVAVLFADIVNFTSYCDEHEAEDVVHCLDRLIGSWEESALLHRVQKIKTIGDAFMAAAGLLEKVDNPVLSCVRFGLDMISAVQRLPNQWNVRVGIDFGPVIAGVIGSRQYLYDLWGDTVNTAARMESHGVPGAITLSMRAWGQIAGQCRGSQRIVEVKGKGLLPTMRYDAFAH
jgi:adenylate cyclase